jgi:hypothetical protein
MAEIGIRKTVAKRFDDVLARVPEALQAEGFGILTRIDVKQALKEKIGVDFRRYRSSARATQLAYQALSHDPDRLDAAVQRRGREEDASHHRHRGRSAPDGGVGGSDLRPLAEQVRAARPRAGGARIAQE